MDQKPAVTSPAASGGSNSPASAEPPSSRRRAGGQKRKASALQTSTTSSTPAKRFVREKAAIAATAQTPIHSGPFTRASRHGPNNFASLTRSSDVVVKVEEKSREAAAAAAREDEESKLEKLEAAMEKEFEVVRSRDANVHVVPNHCGWFSWTKVHALEEHSLPSFFNGKSQTLTPDVYMEIRNWIVKKFHSNPSSQIELKDLSELEIADMDARQEVLKFLDYWGIINFHPLLENDTDVVADGDKATKKDSLLENLFRFEAIQPCRPVVTKPNLTNTAVPSGLFPETAIAEELARLEGPSVEYHCNSCSADCSRKRYHCQKQADYDLCAGCFTDGKFDSNMSASDFILMESAEAPGASGGKWTDQETLLLLEALELYKENWNEIAEHVATKTKAQCILHFVEMPIEDVFFDSDDNPDATPKESTEQAAAIEDTTTPKEIHEKSEDKSTDDVLPPDSQKASSNPEEKSEVKDSDDTVRPDNDESLVVQKTSKSKCAKDVQADEEMHENIALKALSEAFEAVGYPPTPGVQLSFTDVGNPAMALAGFFSRLVGADVAIASARSSLKCLSGKSPGLKLATKHCFPLEDPTDDGKTLASSDCVATNMIQGASKDNHIGEDKGSGDSVPEEKAQKVDSANDAGAAEKCELSSKQECLPNLVKELQEGSSVGDGSQLEGRCGSVNVASNVPSVDNGPTEKVTVTSHGPTSQVEKPKDVNISDSLPSEKSEHQCLEKITSGEQSHPTASPMDVDMSMPQPSALNTEKQTATKKSTKVEGGNEITTVEEPKANKKEKPDLIKNDQSVEKVRRAAVSALSAAAVKAKLLANQEEDHIRQLAASLVEKQLHKLEMKLAFFNEMEGLVMRVREQLDRSRQKLYHERAQIIASRLGIPASSSRGMPPMLPMNRMPMNNANSALRPPMPMMSQRPPISRPMGVLGPNPSNLFPPSSAAGGSMRPSGQGNVSSVGTK